ncbi:DUF5930 domain-containing protein [Amaricoccus sp.]|uniref:DUF5930 domain-containing protein n=1 Tax=Amaricoccus sp. TaxID=1872485 RepID=UPI001B510B6D|nr:DUF5930 domain-containing protein [Amaricoccus sp.]MBP7240950.1 peptidoglycan DD-metalloendopeptidase family protein [Amaricoccus sp.]
MKGAVSATLPERRIFIHTDRGARYLRISTAAQALLVVAGLVLGGWLVAATADFAVDRIAADGDGEPGAALSAAYQARLDALIAERDAKAVEAVAAQKRFQMAMDQIAQQQTAILGAIEGQRELEGALEASRARLRETIEARDMAVAEKERLAEGVSPADLIATLQKVTGKLSEVVVDRDAVAAERATLSSELASAELEIRLANRRQDEMIDELRSAVASSSDALENALSEVGLDVDSTLAATRMAYSGQGGPLVPIGVSSRSVPGEDPTASRFDELMVDVDRVNLLRIALGKVPYAMPVKDPHRFTSGFGYRRDPKGGGRRMHSGVDFAAPQGTPIYAAADGVVESAGRESGYGLAVRIRHEFGFETLYAHQNRMLVKPGQRVSRGDHIGDMGRTGRVTGVHLHYEVHLNGRPVNPMTYVEAARDVF